MAEASREVVVDHADRLHEGVDDGRADELEAARRQFLRQLARDVGLGRNLFRRLEAVDLRPAVNEAPQQRRETRALLHDLEIAARGENRALDLGTVAHDAGVAHQLLEFGRAIARDLLRLEIVEGFAEVVALAQDGDPRQAGLEAVEHQLLVERAVVVFRNPPFLVVIGDVERVLFRPEAALQPVVVQHRAHEEPPAGQSNRAQPGLTGRIAMPPAVSGTPAACASATRSRRNSASPRPLAVAPSMPISLSPAITGSPELGA